jgi:hypothetical protein
MLSPSGGSLETPGRSAGGGERGVPMLRSARFQTGFGLTILCGVLALLIISAIG